MSEEEHIPCCPKCGHQLEKRKFVDCWATDGTPEANENLYCPKCDLRWSETPGPHDFLENWNPEEHAQLLDKGR